MNFVEGSVHGTGGGSWFYIRFPVQVHGNIPARPVALAQALSTVHLWTVWPLYPTTCAFSVFTEVSEVLDVDIFM